MDRAELHGGDEAWITKYREALKITPVETSGVTRFRVVLKDACNVVLSRFRKALETWTRSRRPQLIAVPEATNVARTQSAVSKKSGTTPINKPALKERKQTAGRLKPAGANKSRRLERRA